MSDDADGIASANVLFEGMVLKKADSYLHSKLWLSGGRGTWNPKERSVRLHLSCARRPREETTTKSDKNTVLPTGFFFFFSSTPNASARSSH